MAWTTPGTAVAGDVLTAAFWNEQVRDNLEALFQSSRRLAYATRTSNYSVTSTTVAGAADIFSADLTFTADGTSDYEIVFFCPFVQVSSTSNSEVSVSLVNGAGTDLGILSTLQQTNGTQFLASSIFTSLYVTPSAGSVSYNFRGLKVNGNGTIAAGPGGAGGRVATWAAIYGPVLT